MADIVNLSSHYIGSPGGGVNLYQIPNAGMAVMQDIINATWNQGLDFKGDYEAKIAAAKADFLDLTTTPSVTANTISTVTVAEPEVTIPTNIDTTQVMSMFDTKYLELVALLSDKFSAFRDAYYPDDQPLYSAVESSLQSALDNDSYLPASVQAQIFGDDQARILSDKLRAQDAVIAQFAARRFPLPPDVAASAVMQIEQKAQDEIAESSRKIAILSVEQYRFVIDKAMTARAAAMQSAIEYIKALASGPEMASRLVGVGYDAQSKLISSAASFYNARTAAKELSSKVNQFNSSAQLEAATKNQQAELMMVENKLKALLAEAQAIAQMATSMFNNLHASVGLSASGGTQLSQSGEF